jgi:uncharacterized Rmd1/YagE family protein
VNLNPLKQIYKFNEEAGLLAKGYSDERECAFPIEEALEGFDLSTLPNQIGGLDAKGTSREICKPLSYIGADVDRLDKHLDIIVFSLGSIYKLGLSPQQAMKALGVVATKNMEKLKAGQDSEGKQLKPEGFTGPEAQLQKILDERE